MRTSKFLSRTLRQDPSETETASHRLMLRAGMMLQAAAGVYSYLPLALRSIQKIEQIIREEMNAAGGQEVLMPTLQPIETWQQTGRDTTFGDNLFRLTDRRERGMVLAPTHEEVVTAIAGAHIESYRDLPSYALSDTDQVQRRATTAGRPAARTRVHHEGRVLLRLRRGVAGRYVSTDARGLPQYLPPLRPADHRG